MRIRLRVSLIEKLGRQVTSVLLSIYLNCAEENLVLKAKQLAFNRFNFVPNAVYALNSYGMIEPIILSIIGANVDFALCNF
jgi:hypothetical protein